MAEVIFRVELTEAMRPLISFKLGIIPSFKELLEVIGSYWELTDITSALIKSWTIVR